MRRHLRENINSTLDEWSRAHNGLKYGDRGLGLPGKNSPKIDALFEESKPYYDSIKSNIDIILLGLKSYHPPT